MDAQRLAPSDASILDTLGWELVRRGDAGKGLGYLRDASVRRSDSAEIRYVAGLQSLDGRSVHFRDAWRVAGDGGPGLTWANRNPYARPWLEPDRRIDYVFSGPPLRDGRGVIESCRVVCDDEHDGVWPSDHFGVYAELRTEPLAPDRRLGPA